MSIKTLKVIVPQGIGDIFWVYRKLAPHCDEIEINIAYFKNSPDQDIQQRSKNFVSLFPKVTKVIMLPVEQKQYTELAHHQYNLPNLLKNYNNTPFNYGVNGFLDTGIHLEDIDDLSVEWEFELPTEPYFIKKQDFILMYVSGSVEKRSQAKSLNQLYSIDEWVKIANIYKKKFPNHKLFLIGAKFDANIMKQIASKTTCCEIIIEPEFKKLVWLLKETSFFVGYQSGLNIIADHFNTPQVMFYFEMIKDMKDAWVKPSNRKDFKYCLFTQGSKLAIEIIEHY
jgi:hypothetical protein